MCVTLERCTCKQYTLSEIVKNDTSRTLVVTKRSRRQTFARAHWTTNGRTEDEREETIRDATFHCRTHTHAPSDARARKKS